MLKSRPDRYGAMAVSIHWLSAILILAVLASGFQAGRAGDPADKAALLRVHVPLAIAVLALTIFRIVWWARFDRKPRPVAGAPAWQERAARWVHTAFYVVLIGMAASGIGMVILGGAVPVLVGAPGATLPDFADLPPRGPHGLGARLLVGLVVLHTLAALHHQLVRRDGRLRRMWYGG